MPVDWSMLPNDVVRLVMQRHWILYHAHENAIREAHRACMRQLNTVCNVLFYVASWEVDHSGYGRMLDDDAFMAEVDEVITSRPQWVLDHVRDVNCGSYGVCVTVVPNGSDEDA